MLRTWIALAVVVGLLPAPAPALELTNVRTTYGPAGALRPDNRFLPGDVLFVSFDISAVQLDPKSGRADYQTVMEITDAGGQQVFRQVAPPKDVLLPGGDRIPTFAFAYLAAQQDAGKYNLKVSVTDRLAKTTKSFVYPFEVLPAGFGLVQPLTPCVALLGQDLPVAFSLAGMRRNDENVPEVNVSLELLDAAGRKLYPRPIQFTTKEVHNPPATDLTKLDVIPISLTVFLNRPGQFTIVLDAEDQLSKERRSLRLPLRVLDPAEYTGK